MGPTPDPESLPGAFTFLFFGQGWANVSMWLGADFASASTK